MKLQFFITLLLSCILGCAVSVPQVETVSSLVRSTVQSEVDKKSSVPVWLARVRSMGATLNPYVAGDLIVFANEDGDGIAFDGWIVRSIIGFGLKSPVSISGREGNRKIIFDGRSFEQHCDTWELVRDVWRQTCDVGESSIMLDEEGNIEAIVMDLGDDLGVLDLRLSGL